MEKIINLLLWSAVLPSGTIMEIPIKIILFFICIMLIFKRRYIVVNNKIKILLLVTACLLLWSAIGFFNGYLLQDIIKALKVFGSLILIMMIFNIIISNKLIEYEQIIRTLNHIFLFMVFSKLFIELFYVVGVVTYTELRNFYNHVLDSEVMLLPYQFAGIEFTRISTVNDNIVFLLFGFLVWSKEASFLKKILVVAATFIYSMINYSRFNLIQFIGTIVVLFIIKSMDRFTKRGLLCTVILFVSIISFVSIQYDTIIEPLANRFTGAQVEYSDSFRIEQFYYLVKGIMDAPIIGHGLGAYIPDYIRSESIKSSYELEYLAFLYQFGIIGFILIIGLIIFIAYAMCRTKKKGLILLIYYNLFIWTLKPFFNPNFLSSISGMSIVIISIFKIYYQNKYVK